MREEKFYEELSPYVERVKQGVQDTFVYLYQATYDMTKWFVLNFCKDKNEAEDIIQEIYLDVYRYLPDLKNNLAFCAWQRKMREIAEVMDCDINAVKNLLYHGKRIFYVRRHIDNGQSDTDRRTQGSV